MTLEELLDQGWTYHDTESERLARELEAAAIEEAASGLLVPLLALSTHTIGEHLGDWRRALDLGRRALGGRTPTVDTGRAWGKMSVAASLAGESVEAAMAELSCLEAAGEDFAAALLDMRFMLATALTSAQRTGEAARLYRGALDLAGRIAPSALLERTIAVASNNLGWELYQTAARSAEEDGLMRLCAETALVFWRKAGNWINEERALYLKAIVSNAAGSPRTGLAEADEALAIIQAQGVRPLDTALLHLARASAFAALGDEDGRRQAIAAADAAAAALTAPALKAQFAAERGKVVL